MPKDINFFKGKVKNNALRVTFGEGHASAADVPALMAFLDTEQGRNVCALMLGGQGLNAEVAKRLIPIFQNNQSITKLIFLKSALGDQGIQIIGQALADNQTVIELFLGGNNTSSIAWVQAIAKLLTENRTLQRLTLQESQSFYGKQGAEIFAAALIKSTLRAFANFSVMSCEEAIAIGGGIGPLLTTLRLRGITGLRAVTMRQLVNELSRPGVNLQTLDILQSEINNGGVRVFAEFLGKNPSLRKLCLNGVKDVGAEKLADALLTNDSLTVLDLSDSPITAKGIQAFEKMFATNHTLTTLLLSQHPDEWKASLEGNKNHQLELKQQQTKVFNMVLGTVEVANINKDLVSLIMEYYATSFFEEAKGELSEDDAGFGSDDEDEYERSSGTEDPDHTDLGSRSNSSSSSSSPRSLNDEKQGENKEEITVPKSVEFLNSIVLSALTTGRQFRDTPLNVENLMAHKLIKTKIAERSEKFLVARDCLVRHGVSHPALQDLKDSIEDVFKRYISRGLKAETRSPPCGVDPSKLADALKQWKAEDVKQSGKKNKHVSAVWSAHSLISTTSSASASSSSSSSASLSSSSPSTFSSLSSGTTSNMQHTHR